MIDYNNEVIHSVLITHANGKTSSITREEPGDRILCDVAQNWVTIIIKMDDGGSRQICLNRDDVQSVVIGRVAKGLHD